MNEAVLILTKWREEAPWWTAGTVQNMMFDYNEKFIAKEYNLVASRLRTTTELLKAALCSCNFRNEFPMLVAACEQRLIEAAKGETP